MRKGRSDKGQFHNRPNIALRLAAVMLVMVCVSTWMLAGLLAKYTGSGEGADVGRVAAFHVVATGIPETQTVDASAGSMPSGSYDITVINKSEVAVEYSVYVTLSEALPDWLEVQLDTKAYNQISDDKKTLYFYEAGVLGLADADRSETVPLSFVVSNPENMADYSQADEGIEYSKKLDFEVYVNFVQLD